MSVTVCVASCNSDTITVALCNNGTVPRQQHKVAPRDEVTRVVRGAINNEVISKNSSEWIYPRRVAVALSSVNVEHCLAPIRVVALSSPLVTMGVPTLPLARIFHYPLMTDIKTS